MFTPEERARIRSSILESAAADPRISGGAITGSAAIGAEDRWSDIDLAFGVADGAVLQDVLSDWTARMYEQHEAVHHLDVKAGAWIYRVFLLASTLQVDLAFVSSAEFRAVAPTFRLVFGKTNEPLHAAAPAALDVVGWGWLYALHARSCEASLVRELDVVELSRAFRYVVDALLGEIESVDRQLSIRLKDTLTRLCNTETDSDR